MKNENSLPIVEINSNFANLISMFMHFTVDGILSKVRGTRVIYYHVFNDIWPEFRWISYFDAIPSVKSKLFPTMFKLITTKMQVYQKYWKVKNENCIVWHSSSDFSTESNKSFCSFFCDILFLNEISMDLQSQLFEY